MKVRAILKNYRTTPRKARILIPLVKGRFVNEALVQLDNNMHRASHQLKKLIMSAVSNAEHNFHMEKNNLFVENMLVGEGTKLKRWMSRAFGRATPVLKRTSTVTVVLSEMSISKVESVSKEKALTEKKQVNEKKTSPRKESDKKI